MKIIWKVKQMEKDNEEKIRGKSDTCWFEAPLCKSRLRVTLAVFIFQKKLRCVLVEKISLCVVKTSKKTVCPGRQESAVSRSTAHHNV